MGEDTTLRSTPRQTGHIVQELIKHKCKLCLDDPAVEMCDFASQGDTENLILLLGSGVDANQGDYDGR